jgi:RNA polymerase sigma-70 factor (sigma-E family)
MAVISSTVRDDQFRLFVTQRRGALVRAATLLSFGNAFRAEDLVQTALLRMYLSWARIRPETRDSYAYKVLVNAHLDERRRRYAQHEMTHAEVPDTVAEDPEPLDTETAVFRALAELSPGMRAAVILRHVLDMSVADCADALGCSEGTVKSQTARGLAQLRSALGDRAAIESER